MLNLVCIKSFNENIKLLFADIYLDLWIGFVSGSAKYK